jgi:hypothetical protein
LIVVIVALSELGLLWVFLAAPVAGIVYDLLRYAFGRLSEPPRRPAFCLRKAAASTQATAGRHSSGAAPSSIAAAALSQAVRPGRGITSAHPKTPGRGFSPLATTKVCTPYWDSFNCGGRMADEQVTTVMAPPRLS